MISFGFKWQQMGGHVRVRVFAGSTPGSRANCGELAFRPEEWEVLRAALVDAAAWCGLPLEVEPDVR